MRCGNAANYDKLNTQQQRQGFRLRIRIFHYNLGIDWLRACDEPIVMSVFFLLPSPSLSGDVAKPPIVIFCSIPVYRPLLE